MRKQPQDQPICRVQQVRLGERPPTGATPHSFDYAQDRLQTNRPSVYCAGRIPPTHSPVSGEGYPLTTRFQLAHQLTGMFHGSSAEGHPSQ